MTKSEPDYLPIDDYGIIGDLHTAALVNSEGGIDWCCMPIFDSPSCFAKILDKNIGGEFKVNIADYSQSTLSYLHSTNILRSRFVNTEGAIEIIDYMPVINEDGSREKLEQSFICRHIECTKGVNIDVDIYFNPRFNYGEETQVEYLEHGAIVNAGEAKLYSTFSIQWLGNGKGRIRLSHGDSIRLIFSHGPTNIPNDIESWSDQQLLNTRQFWENWLSQCLYKGRWRCMVERSALTLKLMAFKPTGAIIAAPTTSLPEDIGGIRNWDYRFSWLRDSTLILNALLPLGFKEEAQAYVNWIVRQCPKHEEPMPILYPITEIDTTEEKELPQFEGYRQSSPVRIGNAAKDQIQLDVYGEVIDSLYFYSIYGESLTDEQWQYIKNLSQRICSEWQTKDEGIWEVRGEKQHFTYSKLMCWVGLDRAIKIAEERSDNQHLKIWQENKTAIYDFIMLNCIDPEKKYLMQSPNNSVADASNLLASIVGFLDPMDEIIQNTLDQTLTQLTHNNLVFRYLNDDGLSGEEGAFNICTFWLVEALTLSKRYDEAKEIFDSILNLSSPLGLYAEETKVDELIAVGNFPQAFSHLGLINAAILLNNQNQTNEKPFWHD